MTLEQHAAIFKALSEPVRLRITALLLQQGELCVCDIVDVLQISQSVVSRHLAYLRNSGLVSTRREGVWIYYQLIENDTFVTSLLALFEDESSRSTTLRHDTQRLQQIASRSCS